MLELNFVVIAMLGALMIYMIASRVKMFMNHKRALDDVNHRGDFKSIFTGWSWIGIYSLAIAVSISGGFMFYFNRDQYDNALSWILVFVVIFITSALDVFKTTIVHKTYYNEQGIFHDTSFFKYDSIKNFKPKRGGVSTEVYLYNGASHLIPTKALQQLEDRIVKVHKKK